MVQDPPDYCNFILEQLSSLDGLRSRKMFGSYGLYLSDRFFAVISDDRLYFKTNAQTRLKYSVEGMDCFRPNDSQGLTNYLEVPADVIEEPQMLAEWAIESAGV